MHSCRLTFSWNTLISGFYIGRYCEEGLKSFKQVISKVFSTNRYKYNYLGIFSCTSLMDLRCRDKVHVCVLKSGLQRDTLVFENAC